MFGVMSRCLEVMLRCFEMISRCLGLMSRCVEQRWAILLHPIPSIGIGIDGSQASILVLVSVSKEYNE